MVFSRMRERRTSSVEGRLTSYVGSVMGESSVVMVKRPSKGRSGKGATTSAEMWTWTLFGRLMAFNGRLRRRTFDLRT